MRFYSPKTQKFWRVVEVKIPEEAIEAIEFALNEAGAIGTEATQKASKSASEFVSVRGYFHDLTLKKKDILPYLQKALEIYSIEKAIKGVRCFSTVDKDWLRVWKKHWKPVETERFLILPSWKRQKASSKEKIFIKPGMAFGTGTHETTRLCLEAIEKFFKPKMSFFDIGTGTGILAFAASRISPDSRIVACDIDEEAILQARENAQINGIENIEFYFGSITENSDSFDFVCANLTLDTVLPILPLLLEKTQKILVISGILKEQKEAIEEKLAKYKPRIDSMGDWISVVVKIPQD
jgi:ribosomal protein L11 methyltransferase